MIPYAKHYIDQDDIDAVTEALRGSHLTGGEKVAEFEKAFAAKIGWKYAVAFSSGTAALHASVWALAEEEVTDNWLVPALTFVATAAAVRWGPACPLFSDVCPDTLTMATRGALRRRHGIIAVDYAGQLCDYEELGESSSVIIQDATHSLGVPRVRHPAVKIACYSFHPAKLITTGEGGMAVTDDAEIAARLRAFRSHCMTSTAAEREASGKLSYDVPQFGLNYRMTDFQAALGLSQLGKMDRFLEARRKVTQYYDDCFEHREDIRRIEQRRPSAHHLYVIRVRNRDVVAACLRDKGIGTAVHYPALSRLGATRGRNGDYPVTNAEKAADEVLSIPLYPGVDAERVAGVVLSIMDGMR